MHDFNEKIKNKNIKNIICTILTQSVKSFDFRKPEFTFYFIDHASFSCGLTKGSLYKQKKLSAKTNY